MDSIITRLEELTESVAAQLQFISSDDLSAFVEERQHLIDEINLLKQQSPYTQAQEERLRKVIQFDAVILNKMSSLKVEAAEWLQNRGQAKMQRNAYEAAYTPDSFLMDKRN
ncbi:hypothetical protein ACTHPF_16140 [Paenibacillus sp. SAF-054]|uniref:hypothetical protein n=1 Tax=unclassified Paenibacillus TaxID=185978 RepID=UPI003F7D792D